MANTMANGPLTGEKVLELGSYVAAPFCARLLADFGAEVIKVEPPEGDPVRHMGHRKDGKSLYAASIMRNKSLVALDLRTAEGQDIVKSLVAKMDYVVEGFRPGTLEKWGLGYDVLKAINPRIILVRISGFGQTGPYRDRPGYGPIGEAMSGLRGITGDPDRPPPRVGVPLADYICGLYAAFGAMLAARARDKIGEGQVVDAALYEAAFSFMEPHLPAYAALGVVPKRAGSRLPNSTPNALYPARDGYIQISAPGQAVFRRLVTLMGRPEIADDTRFDCERARNENAEALDIVISGWTSSHELNLLEQRLVEAEIPAARIYSIADIFTDPHFAARDMLLDVLDDEYDNVVMAGVVPKLGGTPGRVTWPGRTVYADTRHILSELDELADREKTNSD